MRPKVWRWRMSEAKEDLMGLKVKPYTMTGLSRNDTFENLFGRAEPRLHILPIDTLNKFKGFKSKRDLNYCFDQPIS